MYTRRSVLIGIAIAERMLASGGDFWDKKPPSQWTAEEIDRLLTKSPWAKQVAAEYLSGPLTGCSGGPGVWSERPPLARGPIGFPRTARGVKSGYVATVRWESAQPILLAMQTKLTDVFVNHYVISVSGLPLTGSSDCKASTAGDDLKNLKEFATLRGARADVVERQISSTSNLLFGFPKAAVRLTEDTKDVEFACHLDQLAIKVKFNLKGMVYAGRPAL